MDDDPDYQLSIHRETELAKDISSSILKEAVSAALIRHGISRAQISIALVDDARIASINESYLHHEGPTDVITFDLRDDVPTASNDSINSPEHGHIDGEVIISVETALRESGRRGHSLNAETALYTVHGTLHLIGFDDKTKVEADRMHALEDVILSTVGVGTVFGKPDNDCD